MPSTAALRKAELALRDFALAYPETIEEFPWGHRAIKVRGKAFVFIVLEGAELSLSMKLPISRVRALAHPFAEPTGYGLGKSGWVTARFTAGSKVPVALLRGWIGESFHAIAPKKLVEQMTGKHTAR